ncbi:ADP-ribosylglycohydrolase family protein [Pseudonocardia sp. KRD-169]|uniref:ADP-ribosylglycohydrolase family protein n=1 Tax=Pseudonocardia abyssalis TaxID=2792008 RepID=A0ABS6US25_9PSEU|nr:ADP-ribosylglycohydrolase family protein [Pseudonocardia abyssalis]MBW0135054.1 ADP-ribosylglycohydrolase family protein [Pseudonocardia abyssalis]
MLGAAIGDALAAPVEGAVGVTEAQLSAWTRSRRVLRYTGLTATMLTVGEHLAAADPHAPLDEQSLLEALVQNRRRAPWRWCDTMPGQASQATGLPTMRPSASAGSAGDIGGAVGVTMCAVARAELGPRRGARRARTGRRARPVRRHPDPTRPGIVDEDAAVAHATAVGQAMRTDPAVAAAVHPFVERIAVGSCRSRPRGCCRTYNISGGAASPPRCRLPSACPDRCWGPCRWPWSRSCADPTGSPTRWASPCECTAGSGRWPRWPVRWPAGGPARAASRSPGWTAWRMLHASPLSRMYSCAPGSPRSARRTDHRSPCHARVMRSR